MSPSPPQHVLTDRRSECREGRHSLPHKDLRNRRRVDQHTRVVNHASDSDALKRAISDGTGQCDHPVPLWLLREE